MRRLLIGGALLFVLLASPATAYAAPAVTTPSTAPTINGQPASRVPGNPCGPAAGPQCGQPPVTDNGPSTIGGAVGSGVDAGVGAATGAVGSAVGAAANSAGFDIGGMLAGWATSWSSGILRDVSLYTQKAAGVTTLGTGPYDTLYSRMEVLGGLIAFAAFCVYQFGGRTPQARLMSLARLAGAGVIMPIVPMVVSLAYGLVTSLTAYASAAFGGNIGTVTAAMSKATGDLGGWSTAAAFMVCGLVLIGGILVFVELVMLGVAVPIIVAFLPLMLGLAVHESMIPSLKRAVAVLVAAVTGGFVIAVVGSVGAAVLAGTTASAGGLIVLLEGAVILLLAAVSPWVLGGLIGAHGSLSRRHATAPVAATAATAAKVAAIAA